MYGNSLSSKGGGGVRELNVIGVAKRISPEDDKDIQRNSTAQIQEIVSLSIQIHKKKHGKKLDNFVDYLQGRFCTS